MAGCKAYFAPPAPGARPGAERPRRLYPREPHASGLPLEGQSNGGVRNRFRPRPRAPPGGRSPSAPLTT
jgi:hypothetical protein